MLTLSEVRGQSRVVELLQRAIKADRVPGAYLFVGPAGCGKYSTALAFAKAMNCLRAPGQGCQGCEACSKIDDGIHPDVRTLQTEGAANRIPIDTIRKHVIPAMAMAPHEARARFFLIEEATAMLAPAANALLKTLEEPPPQTYFILCTRSATKLLPTIRSRCQRISFGPLAAQMQAELRGEDEQADMIRHIATTITQVMDQRGLDGILSIAKEAKDRSILLSALEEVAQHCHRAAREAAQHNDLHTARVHAQRAGTILDSMMAIGAHNAHGQLAIEHLLVALRAIPLPAMRSSSPVSGAA